MREQRIKRILTIAGVVALVSFVAVPSGLAQEAPAGGQGGQAAKPMPPIPRLSDGTPSLGWVDPKDKGVWKTAERHWDLAPVIVDRKEEGIPHQPWAKALYDYRVKQESKDDPEGFCLPPGGTSATANRTGGSWEFLQLPEQKRILRIFEAGAHVWQTIYMDGRPHPPEVDDIPSWLGHSIGHWEGDTLVVDTVGFNEGHWASPIGGVRTSQHHVIERFTRTNYNTIKYESTIDDPGAYTRPWKIGYNLAWTPGAELQEIICLENNRWTEHHDNLGTPE